MVLAAAGVTVAGIVEIYRKKALEKEDGAHIQVYIFLNLYKNEYTFCHI